MNYAKYINSKKWELVRRRKLKAVGYKCQECHRGCELDVHHLTYERFGNERLDDIVVLCKRCHNDLHYYENRILVDERMTRQQRMIVQEEYELRKQIMTARKN